jgi:endonuclease/exonuclease/phosphatase family metal-dependent hydrolase
MTLVRVATYNLENLDSAPAEGPPLAARVPVLRATFEELAADVVCLQEVSARRLLGGRKGPRALAALDEVLRGTKYASYERCTSLHRDGHGPMDVQNLVVLSRYPIVASHQYWHDLVAPATHLSATATPFDPTPWRIEWDRPILRATIALAEGRTLEVLNLHLRAPTAAFVPGQKLDATRWRTAAGWAEGFYLGAMKRAGQALEARLLVDRILETDPNSLIAVCGDMNAEASEMPLRILRSDVEDTGNTALTGATLTALEATVSAPERYSVIHAGRRLMLDHILASAELAGRVRDVKILNRNLPDEATSPLPAGSFHAPVVASFDM